MICGRQLADSGTIRLEGHRIETLRAHRRARLGSRARSRNAGVLVEETCLDNVLFAAQDKRLGAGLPSARPAASRARDAMLAEARRLLTLVNLEAYADAPAAALSYGQRRLLEIVSVLMTAAAHPAASTSPPPGSIRRCSVTLRDFLRRSTTSGRSCS